MPIHEYYCPDNHRIYTFYARTLSDGARTPRCPANPAFRMERLISQVAILRKTSAVPADGQSPAEEETEDPRMERALAEMEREFAGMDESNPDPRMLGRMMRKMAEISGQSMPGAFDEMTRRLEAGEDPERLEADYGDVLDGLDGEAPSEESAGPKAGRLRNLFPARRDPTLYELRDFIEA